VNPENNISVQTGPREIDGGYSFLQLSKVVRKNGSLAYQPITLLPGWHAQWSTDSRHILIEDQKWNPIGVYGLGSSTPTYLVGNDGFVDIQSKTGSATGTFVSDANGNINIKEGNRIVPFDSQLQNQASSSALFLTPITLPQQIRFIGWIQ